MIYNIIHVQDHVDVYDEHDNFIFSEDTYAEARKEIKKIEQNNILIKQDVV